MIHIVPVWRNWQTRTTQNRVPSGVPVRPRPLVSKREKRPHTFSMGSFLHSNILRMQESIKSDEKALKIERIKSSGTATAFIW